MTIKKVFLVLMTCFMAVGYAQAQNVTEQKVNIKKMDANAFVADFGDVDEALLEKAVEKYFEKKLSGKDLKYSGYTLRKGIVWKEVSADKSDIYYNIQSSKKSTKLILAFSKGYDNFISSQSDATTAANIKKELSNIQLEINEVKKEEDKNRINSNLEKLIKEKKQLEDKAKEIERDIKKKEEEISKAKSELERVQ